MTEVVSVRFRNNAKSYDFDPKGLRIEAGEQVIVETAQGTEFVRCVMGNHEVPDQTVVQPLRPVLRVATAADCRIAARNREREREAFAFCEERILARGLEMRLTDVECSFDSKKLLFFFTADCRVDFRELVKDLAAAFHARIELRQIGVRDEAKMIGGLGICGRPLCCGEFLEDFVSVSIKMAKTQNLSLNPTKISGTCGRLMCCLKYEQNAYEDAVRRMPKADSFVDTPDGLGNVCGVDLLREEVQVRLDNGEGGPKKYKTEEVCVLRSGKGTREGIEIPQKRPERVKPAEGVERSGESSKAVVRPVTEIRQEHRTEKPSYAERPVRGERQPKAEPVVSGESQPKTENRHKEGGAERLENAHKLEVFAKQERKQERRQKPVRSEKRPEHSRQVPKEKGNPAQSVQENRQEKPAIEQGRQAQQGQKEQRPNRRQRNHTQHERRQERSSDANITAGQPERMPVRSKRDTTAEMKAAADRAAQRGNGQENKDSQLRDSKNGQQREGKRGQYHRRPHHFQRKKNSGEGGTSQT